MPILTFFAPSTRQNKRYMIHLQNPKQTIHFGLKGGSTYIDHKDKKKRGNYLKRHKPNENWEEITAGSLSARILWGNSTNLLANLKAFLKYFNISTNDESKISL